MARTLPSARTAAVRPQNEIMSDATIAALRPLARLLAPLIREELSADAREEWIDQTCSPLGRRRHRELARRGAFPAFLDGRRWRARRADVDAYIQAQRPGAPLDTRQANDHATAEDDDHDVQAVLAEVGLELSPQRARPARSRRS